MLRCMQQFPPGFDLKGVYSQTAAHSALVPHDGWPADRYLARWMSGNCTTYLQECEEGGLKHGSENITIFCKVV